MALVVEDISVAFRDKAILKDISLKVNQGQFVGIIGSNGSGKSTLLKTIYKVLKPTKGSIFLDDLNILVSKEIQMAKRLSVVNQFNDINFDLSVEQMVLLGRTPHKKILESTDTYDLKLLDEVLEKTSLVPFKNRSYLSLSGGEKQRVVLARALIQEPEYIILDEPTNHLDVKYKLDILEIVKALNIGVLSVLHDLEDTARYCDYIYTLKEGVLVAEGPPKEVLTESLISDIYDVTCQIYQNPITQEMGFYYTKKETK